MRLRIGAYVFIKLKMFAVAVVKDIVSSWECAEWSKRSVVMLELTRRASYHKFFSSFDTNYCATSVPSNEQNSNVMKGLKHRNETVPLCWVQLVCSRWRNLGQSMSDFCCVCFHACIQFCETSCEKTSVLFKVFLKWNKATAESVPSCKRRRVC